MKIYKLNSLTTFLCASLLLGFIVFLPIAFIEALWNSTLGKTYPNIVIDFWQALILWLIVLVVLNISGLFKFEFIIEAHGSENKDTLKKKVQDLKNKPQESHENEKSNSK